MVKKKQTYESPEIRATRVELESSICAGSVDFGDGEKNKQIDINAQEVATVTNNDFSGNEWSIGNTTTNN